MQKTNMQIDPLRALRLKVNKSSDYTSFQARKQLEALRRNALPRQEAHISRIEQHNKITFLRSILSDNQPSGHCDKAPKPIKRVMKSAVSEILKPDLIA